MDLLTDPTAVATDPGVPALTGTRGYFTGGVPGITSPTRVRYWHLNAITEEIVNAIIGAGLTPAAGNNSQLLAAIQALVGQSMPAPMSAAKSAAITAGYTDTITVSFTAPIAGTVMAFGGLNLNLVGNVAAGSGVQCTLSVNGTAASGDNTGVSQSHFAAVAVAAGTVSVSFKVQQTGPATTGLDASYRVGSMFVPG